ncbi:MAG: nucleoid-associated protein [Eubacterium sp.]
MNIQRAILHIIDFVSGVYLPSQHELDTSSEVVRTYVETHIERSQSESRANLAAFSEDSSFRKLMQDYLDGRKNFVDFTQEIAENLKAALEASDADTSFDLLAAEFTDDDGPQLALLLLDHRTAYTHLVEHNEEGTTTTIIRNHAILPGDKQKAAAAALINKSTMRIRYRDKAVEINGQKVNLLQDEILQCEKELANHNLLVAVEKITRDVAEEFGQNAPLALARAKTYISENAESTDRLSPDDVGREVFAGSPHMLASYDEKIQDAQLPSEAVVDQEVAVKKGRSQKIKTDTGIEITFPAEYAGNDDFIEFINQPDGTISIAVKNIGKIISRL